MKFTKYFTLTLVFISLFSFSSVAEKPMQSIDISGTWTGKRLQFNQSKTDIVKSFEYEYELVQDGDKVEGISRIYSADGNYAEIHIRGILTGNKFHFEEYAVEDEIRPFNMVWCYKVGTLTFVKAKDRENVYQLVGATNSYMTTGRMACSGGYTVLEKEYDETIASKTIADGSVNLSAENIIAAYPNPFIERTNIKFDLEETALVQLKVYDLSGKFMASLNQEELKAGSHSFNFNAADFGDASGVFVANLQINDEVHSLQLVGIQ